MYRYSKMVGSCSTAAVIGNSYIVVAGLRSCNAVCSRTGVPLVCSHSRRGANLRTVTGAEYSLAGCNNCRGKVTMKTGVTKLYDPIILTPQTILCFIAAQGSPGTIS